jgi:filamentous hemagglutinin
MEVWEKMAPAEQWAANQKFLDRAIARGDEIILASPVGEAKPGSFFARELEYLRWKGFTLGRDGSRMVPPRP